MKGRQIVNKLLAICRLCLYIGEILFCNDSCICESRFAVAGITEYLNKKEKSRLEYERIKADIEQESERYDEFLEELEARKKYHGTKAYGRQSTRKRGREER